MFSGIIERLGTVRARAMTPNDMTVTIATNLSDLALGESIAVNGACLTVAAFGPDGTATVGDATFHVSRETLDRTALGRLAEGRRVNLERATTPSTRLSGHIVQGHVDGIGHLHAVERVGASRHLTVMLPRRLRKYVVEKGSIALDGVSLTVNALGETAGETFPIHLMLIPHSWEHTVFHDTPVGAPVNVEVDVLAKYVESLLKNGEAA